MRNAANQEHTYFMERCLYLAQKGAPNAYPNPLVGCVIVHHGQIIAEGFHRQFGQAHAEVNAINQLKDNSIVPKCILYVNLEPCAHTGKTPPCANLIVKTGFKQVVVGTVDPYSEVSGKGIARMRDAGIEVVVGVMSNECRQLNRRFFHNQLNQRPYVFLKWAQTADGFLDEYRTPESEKKALKVSNKHSSLKVHKIRSEVDAILIGAQTALLDNPQLTTRLWPGTSPLKIVLDPEGRVPEQHPLLMHNALHFVDQNTRISSKTTVGIEWGVNALDQVLKELYARDIRSVLVEGGSYTLQRFLESGYWNEALVIQNKTTILDGVQAPPLPGKPTFTESIEDDVHFYYENSFSK